MMIYTTKEDLAFKAFTFPDGQPHFKLEADPAPRGVDPYSPPVVATIEMALKSPNDLFLLALAKDVLHNNGYTVNFDCRYLLGARMDRAIDEKQPFTLQTVTRFINGLWFNRVRILDCHSDVAIHSMHHCENLLPTQIVKQVDKQLGYPMWVVPDKGAESRVGTIRKHANIATSMVYCEKVRDPQTGALSGFAVHRSLPKDVPCLIIDDICDGGGTFVGLAKELRKAGTTRVYLYVTHGIFSKGLPLEGIDHVYTTDSYPRYLGDFHHTTIPISMRDI